MTDAYNFLMENGEAIIGTLTAIVAAASGVNAVWGRPENKWLGYAHKAVTFLALNFAKAKNKDEPKTKE